MLLFGQEQRNWVATYQGEIGNGFYTRIEGTCIKHHMGSVAIKLREVQPDRAWGMHFPIG